jgi:hypothetical protein
LTEREVELAKSSLDGMWGNNHVDSMTVFLQATLGLAADVCNRTWALTQDPNFFWDGNPYSVRDAQFWAKGWWPQSQHTKEIHVQLGCLRCGYRTPVIHPWGPSIQGVSGADKIKHVFKILFRSGRRRDRG